VQLRYKIVDIGFWLDSPFYLGAEARSLRPYWRKKIIEYFREADPQKRNFIFTGSQRAGKTYAALIIIIRFIYEIGAYYDFPALFGLSPTTLPRIIFFSFSKGKADSTGIARLIRMLDRIPFFQHPLRQRRQVQTLVQFPWVVVMPGSQVEDAIGDDVIGAVIDEANIRGTAKSQAVQAAQTLFREIRMRSETTFSHKGRWAGFSGILATAGVTTSFTDMEVAKAKLHNNRFLVEAAVYDVHPEGHSDERFDVFPGNGQVPAFIVGEPTEDVAGAIASLGLSVEQFVAEQAGSLIRPPASLKHHYTESLSAALQNLSGHTQAGDSLFISNPAIIRRMFDRDLKYPSLFPVKDNTPLFGVYDTLLPEEVLSEDIVNSTYAGESVYVHIDMAQVNDPVGFAALYFSEECNKIMAVLLTRLYLNRNVSGNEIDPVKVMGLITAMWRMGINIKTVTCDGYNSEYIITRCKLLLGREPMGVDNRTQEKAFRFSLDKSPAGHITMLNFMKLGMYRLYPCPALAHELENLRLERFSGVVDHPANSDPSNPTYFKDLTDAVGGASFQLSVFEQLSYEDILVNAEVSKARQARGKEDLGEAEDEGAEDFYSGLDFDDGSGMFEETAVLRKTPAESANSDYLSKMEAYAAQINSPNPWG